jgi:hypothetical protein
LTVCISHETGGILIISPGRKVWFLEKPFAHKIVLTETQNLYESK